MTTIKPETPHQIELGKQAREEFERTAKQKIQILKLSKDKRSFPEKNGAVIKYTPQEKWRQNMNTKPVNLQNKISKRCEAIELEIPKLDTFAKMVLGVLMLGVETNVKNIVDKIHSLTGKNTSPKSVNTFLKKLYAKKTAKKLFLLRRGKLYTYQAIVPEVCLFPTVESLYKIINDDSLLVLDSVLNDLPELKNALLFATGKADIDWDVVSKKIIQEAKNAKDLGIKCLAAIMLSDNPINTTSICHVCEEVGLEIKFPSANYAIKALVKKDKGRFLQINDSKRKQYAIINKKLCIIGPAMLFDLIQNRVSEDEAIKNYSFLKEIIYGKEDQSSKYGNDTGLPENNQKGKTNDDKNPEEKTVTQETAGEQTALPEKNFEQKINEFTNALNQLLKAAAKIPGFECKNEFSISGPKNL